MCVCVVDLCVLVLVNINRCICVYINARYFLFTFSPSINYITHWFSQIYWCDLGQSSQWLKWGWLTSYVWASTKTLLLSQWKLLSIHSSSVPCPLVLFATECWCIFNVSGLLWGVAPLALSNGRCCSQPLIDPQRRYSIAMRSAYITLHVHVIACSFEMENNPESWLDIFAELLSQLCSA